MGTAARQSLQTALDEAHEEQFELEDMLRAEQDRSEHLQELLNGILRRHPGLGESHVLAGGV
eukprot:6797673-Prorocentrum_lima.AAC.1